MRLKSFSKAAQTCFRTQPAISAQIRQLEYELKAELFERFGSRISLTSAGKLFATFAEQLMETRRMAQNALSELEMTPRGELVIAANEATCIYVLPAVFAEFKEQFPGIQLQVNRSYGSRVVEAVMENVADFGLTQLPVAEKRVQVVEIYRDEIHCIVPAGHPLAALDRVQCEDLQPYPMLLPQSGRTRTRLNAWFEKIEDDLRISMELDSTETMKKFVVAGLGVSFLASLNCEDEVAAGALKTIPLAPEPMTRKLGLIYRKDKALSKASLGFIEVVLDHFGSHTRPPAAR
ncbi:MAG: transcriptional regulator, LysR family [Bryobacterales bacterium]|nr:transcriptional regulator, LysR family [Bryobacterales bacterium]